MIETADLQRIEREIKILKKIRHPHIVQLFDVYFKSFSIIIIIQNIN